jgi:hypothetical protein
LRADFVLEYEKDQCNGKKKAGGFAMLGKPMARPENGAANSGGEPG